MSDSITVPFSGLGREYSRQFPIVPRSVFAMGGSVPDNGTITRFIEILARLQIILAREETLQTE